MSFMREANTEPIPGYRLIEPLGSGGFGEVWKCEAPGGLFKAVKFVYGNLNSLDVDCVRAEQEQRALQRIKEVRHPFVCSLDLIKVIDGELVIVMELAERTLHDLMVECQAAGLIGIPRGDLLRYMGDAAEALDHMNEKHNLQHLDVKPRNLFLIAGHVKVADFGLVKHLERQSASGLMGGVTPLYAAPETFGGKITQQSDQYSLAVVYQELLTGQRPFAGKNVRQLASQHLQEEPDLRSLSEAERPVVGRALAKDPNRRWPNCFAFVSALYKARSPSRMQQPEPEPALVASENGVAKVESMREIYLDDPASLPDGEDADSRLPGPLPSDDLGINSDLGITVPQPETGALRPTLIIGIGAFGRKAILELRCRFLDRFGDLQKLPLLRFLCVDTDPEAAQSACRGAPDVALTRNEFFHLPLQPVANYRRRNLEHLSEWLPREKIYAMPRSLQTQGSRALGRLAFTDNQQRLLARLRREVQEITNPEAIYRSVTDTGLALRDNAPRLYVIGAAGGGSSGLLPDLGYAVRRMLAQLRHPDSKVSAFLLCGAPQDPATPKPELANIYATLTELNHFSDPAVRFAAQYGVDGQRLVDEHSPFSSIYMMPLAHRTPDALEQVVANLGNYLFHELATPLGLKLEPLRQDDQAALQAPAGLLAAPLRSFGTYAVWFPRGLLLRLAGRQACLRLIQGWLALGKEEIRPEAGAQVRAFLEKHLHNPELDADVVARHIEHSTTSGNLSDAGQTQGEILTGILAKLEEQMMQPIAQEDPANWAKQALTRIRDWVGSGDSDQEIVNDWRKTRLTRALGAAANQAAEMWDKQLSAELFALMEHPGARVAAAEAALEELESHFHVAAEAMKDSIAKEAGLTAEAWRQLDASLQEVMVGNAGFRLFGGRSRARLLRTFMDQLAHFARQRLREEILGAVRHSYALLVGRLAERGRDLGFVRQRMRHLQESLESGPIDPEEDLASTRPGAEYTLTRSPLPSAESFWEAIRQSATARVVLPDNEQDLERASVRFLQTLLPDQWESLDRELHERILVPRGGLHGACMNSGDLTRQLMSPLLDEASGLLGQHLPIMDVAQILSQENDAPTPGNGNGAMSDAASGGGASGEVAINGKWAEQLKDYLQRAQPLIQGKLEKTEHTFLLVPASAAGRALAEAVHAAFPEIKHVRVAGQSDLMLCREQGGLTAGDLQKLFQISRGAYEAACTTPAGSPHARFDILDWMPLDP
ncbi:MAG: protein kinase [Planctomycetes bacterium]|nr:protein kinase [Planctomycetota bacterium]